ncbi:ABC transporter substrate-binding protein [Pseudonocardia nigra]|uniref:ABC transporter substrate-binding protein n=1 Tax=Pseudonocardia nigra TaxID=1921578 RepID=UPI001FEA1BB1|nr:ABC transporter substrate-binding protein [Pseudonocardia nigra]
MEQGYDTPPTLLGTLDVNLEALAALEPDLILDTRSSGEQARHEQLTGLGDPVVGIPDTASAAYLTSWEDQLELIGTALGRTEEATELRAGLDARFAEVAAANPAFDRATVAVAARTSEGYGAYVEGDGRVEFLRRLGFVNSPAVQELAGDNFYVPVSQERMDLLDADLTVTFPIGFDPALVTDDPLYQVIPSVAGGRSVLLSDPTLVQAFSSASAVGLSYALDATAPLFAAALGERGGGGRVVTAGTDLHVVTSESELRELVPEPAPPPGRDAVRRARGGRDAAGQRAGRDRARPPVRRPPRAARGRPPAGRHGRGRGAVRALRARVSASVWDASTWPSPDDVPTAQVLFRGQMAAGAGPSADRGRMRAWCSRSPT